MRRETVVLAFMAVLIGLAVVRLVTITKHQGAPGLLSQVAFGLCCGTLGAVAAAAPYADVIPDRFEVPLLIGAPLALIVALAAQWWARSARRRERLGVTVTEP